jgi:hypothetical protein
MNEPAFPTIGAGVGDDTGMTLRDYFAAKAMQSLLTTANGVVGTNRYEHYVAKTAFVIADAMMKAREQ